MLGLRAPGHDDAYLLLEVGFQIRQQFERILDQHKSILSKIEGLSVIPIKPPSPFDDDNCFKVAQASRHSGYPRSANRDKIVSTQ